MKKMLFTVAVATLLAAGAGCRASKAKTGGSQSVADTSVVYMTEEITPESIVRMYELLGREAHGKVAIKLSMGEPGGDNYLKPELVGDFVRLVDGTFIDANTAYGGRRATTQDHLQAAREHGFLDLAPVDILDSEGETDLPVTGGTHITRDIVGRNFLDYDFTVILSHFKGHAMGGFGGAVKNMSIGMASANGKRLIHSGGASTENWGNPTQEQFLETMAEAAKAIADH